MKSKFVLTVLGFWVYLGALIVVWKTFPSPLMNAVFFLGASSLFVTGAVYLYRLRKQFKR